jgi:CheY-like chemotaxis protein
MQHLEFVLGKPIEFEESMTCEFKEVKGQSPIQAIGKTIDEYIVAFLNEAAGSVFWGIRDTDRTVVGVHLNQKMRDELRQVVGQKIAAIAPPVLPDLYAIPFHQVIHAERSGVAVEDTFVVEVRVLASGSGLYLTGSGEAYRKTLGGTKKLTGAELLSALLLQLQTKAKTTTGPNEKVNVALSWMPSVAHRAKVVRPLLRGASVLWVDDNPRNNLYERMVLTSLGIRVDIALSTEEALFMTAHMEYDVIISDMKRGADINAGRELLEQLLIHRYAVPVVYYIGRVDRRLGSTGGYAITDRPDELLHYLFDVLERRKTGPG